MSTINDLYDFSKLYDENGLCRLCGKHQSADHVPRCPGELLNRDDWKLRVTFEYGGCGRGCCPWTKGKAEANNITDLAQRVVAITDGETPSRVNLDLAYKGTPYVGDIHEEIRRIEKEAKELEESRERESERRERRDTYIRSLRALEAERNDLVPAAYERRLAELRDAYKDVL
jgi:hypothetical protein